MSLFFLYKSRGAHSAYNYPNRTKQLLASDINLQNKNDTTITQVLDIPEERANKTLTAIFRDLNNSNISDNSRTEKSEMKNSDINIPVHIVKRSTTGCILSDRSTCPWYYNDNNEARCLHDVPIGCDPQHCLLRCDVLYAGNQPLACISVRPCIIPAQGGQTNRQCN